jgi:chromosome segregation ATPase
VSREQPRTGKARPAKASQRQPSVASRPTVDTTLQNRRNAQRKRFDQAEDYYAAAEAEREQAERALDAHQHRLADLEADLVRLNEQLEQTRQALREARKQTARLQSAVNQAARNAPH